MWRMFFNATGIGFHGNIGKMECLPYVPARNQLPQPMKIDPDEFRVRPDEKVKLKKWPTRVKPCYKSKEHCQQILAEHTGS